MTTSGTSDQALTGRDIVTAALELLGASQLGYSPGAAQAAQALRQLNLMFKGWGTRPHLALMEEGSLTLVNATASYTLPTDVRRVVSVRRRTSNIDTPMTQWSREDYFDFPTKATSGMPINWYADDQLSTCTLFVQPVPSTVEAASTTLKYTYARQIEVFTLASTADLPQEWQEALIYGLAVRLMPFYPQEPNTAQLLMATAQEAFEALTSDDQESASLFFQPSNDFCR